MKSDTSLTLILTAPEPVQCPASHPVALERGKCCCKESIVTDQILAPSIATLCNECDNGIPDDPDNSTTIDKIICFTKCMK